MTRYEIEDFIAGLTYKEGWRFHCEFTSPSDFVLHMDYWTADARTGGGRVRLQAVEPVTHYETFDTDHLKHMIFKAIDHFESHERMEWLRYKGTLLFDPHPNGQSAFFPS